MKGIELAIQALRAAPSSWIQWWNGLNGRQKIAPAAWILAYWSVLAALHGLTIDTVKVGVFVIFLAYLGRRARELLIFLLPFVLTGMLYDSMRFYKDIIRGPIHVREPYLFDKKFFGIHTAQGVLTPNEWFQLHTHWTLDLITGLFYIGFIPIFACFGLYYRYILPKLKSRAAQAAKIVRQAHTMAWGFFWLNALGYSTYYWFSAAPPWYVAMKGLGPADLSVHASPAGCLRFDHLVGMPIFQDFYAKSNDVFGSIPSLHVAYPLLAVFFAYRLKSGRALAWLYYFGMCFSAVYLNHHYLLDIIWGSAYAIGIAWITERVMMRSVAPEPFGLNEVKNFT